MDRAFSFSLLYVDKHFGYLFAQSKDNGSPSQLGYHHKTIGFEFRALVLSQGRRSFVKLDLIIVLKVLGPKVPLVLPATTFRSASQKRSGVGLQGGAPLGTPPILLF